MSLICPFWEQKVRTIESCDGSIIVPPTGPVWVDVTSDVYWNAFTLFGSLATWTGTEWQRSETSTVDIIIALERNLINWPPSYDFFTDFRVTMTIDATRAPTPSNPGLRRRFRDSDLPRNNVHDTTVAPPDSGIETVVFVSVLDYVEGFPVDTIEFFYPNIGVPSSNPLANPNVMHITKIEILIPGND